MENQLWSLEEEAELAWSWLDISEDAITGKDQGRDKFWLRVTNRLRLGMQKGDDYWTSDQLNTKWVNMNKEVIQFNGLIKI